MDMGSAASCSPRPHTREEASQAMLEKNFIEVYDKFKLQFYRRVFELVRERDGSLSAMEAFSLEVIKMLGEPTVGQFADFLNISQSNATYKVNNLIKKGYLERENSQKDRREYHLILSEKYLTTERSWAMNRMVRPMLCLRSFRRLMTWARMETSSAEIGSSAIITSGFIMTDLATPILCLCPPENSCG